MMGAVVLAILALVGYSVSALDLNREQNILTTPATTTDMPVPSTTISLSPQTSISVHHTIVRNQPAYPYPFTESSTLQTDGTEDASYYYTYEDISEGESKKLTSTISPTTYTSTVKPTVKSFWNSQKALLDARRKESSQKFKPTYTRQPSIPKESKPSIEFKVREKPKFGQANKSKFSSFSTSTANNLEVTSSKPIEVSTSSKVVKTNNQLNLSIQKLSDKEAIKNTLKSLNLIPNQLVGRVGEIPIQNSLASQLQSPIQAQSTIVNSFGGSRPSKFDASVGNVQFIDNARKLQQQQQSLQNIQNQPTLRNNLNQPALLTNLKPQPLLNLNQQQLQLNSNQQQLLNQQPLSNINQNQQSSLNLNQNQQPLLNLNQQPLLNLKQKPSLNNFNSPPGNAFIAASAPSTTSSRSAAPNGQSQASSLLQRLGALGLNLNGNGGNGGLGNAILGRDGGGGYGGGGDYGGGGGAGKGFVLNLGAIPDPITFILKLLSLIPRPLLDLNGRIFFGIELGKNAGLTSGVSGGGAKPAYG